MSQVKRSIWCTTLWSLRKSRNLKSWNDVDENNTRIYHRTATFLNQWQWVNLKRKKKKRAMGQYVYSRTNVAPWRKPHFGMLKCKTDLTFYG